MLKIRLQRVGRKHEPVFRLVLTDSKNGPKSGKAIEVLGSYDSRAAENANFDNEKIKNWVSKGAQLSDTVHNILVKRKVIDGKIINILPPSLIEKTKKAKAEAIEQARAEVAKQEIKDEPQVDAPESKTIETTPEATAEVDATIETPQVEKTD